MHKTDASARWDAIDNFDADKTDTVTSRNEFKVVGQSPLSNGGKTEKQPSWAGAAKTHKASTKTWSK
jgi:hypothetical protein